MNIDEIKMVFEALNAIEVKGISNIETMSNTLRYLLSKINTETITKNKEEETCPY